MSEAVTNAELAKRVGFNAVPAGGNATAGKIPVFTGTGLTIAEQIQGLLGGAAIANLGYSGVLSTIATGEASVAYGDILYPSNDGSFYKTLALNTNPTYPGQIMAMEALTGGGTLLGLHLGYARNNDWNITPGSLLYISDAVAGAFGATKPTDSGSIIQIVGYAFTETIMFFNPNSTWIEL